MQRQAFVNTVMSLPALCSDWIWYICGNIAPNVGFHLFACGILCYCFVASSSRYKTRYRFKIIDVRCSKTGNHMYCNTSIMSSLHHFLYQHGWNKFIHGDINSHRRHRDICLKTKMIFCNISFVAIHIITFKLYILRYIFLTHCGRVTQICVFTLQLCRTGDADLRF